MPGTATGLPASPQQKTGKDKPCKGMARHGQDWPPQAGPGRDENTWLTQAERSSLRPEGQRGTP